MPETRSASWYVVHTKPRQEARALENLQNQGFECFLPVVKVEKRRLQKVRVVQEPLFSRYLFIQLDECTQNWSPIRSTLGVSKLVSFGPKPAKVPAEFVQFLRQAPEQQVVRMFSKGDSIKITQGPLAGLEGVFQALDGEQRAFVLVELLGKPHALKVLLDEVWAMG